MITRCLLKFSDALKGANPEDWGALVTAQPEVCPHGDCSRGANCRAVCTEYARMQWRMRAQRMKDEALRKRS